jgi:hypothetical protein
MSLDHLISLPTPFKFVTIPSHHTTGTADPLPSQEKNPERLGSQDGRPIHHPSRQWP